MYEVEIKSLLGSEENALALKKKLEELGERVRAKGTHSQRSHYFIVTPDDIPSMEKRVLPHVKEDTHEKLRKIFLKGEDHSVRTKVADGKVLFVVKASVDEGSSTNTVSRMEFEEEVDVTMEELDQILLDCGLEYQAKWSRDREEFEVGDMSVTIDRNAGYGYVAEFEKTTDSGDLVESIKSDLLAAMQEFELEELPQDRLERMFKHYNQNWEEYYGTDKVFTIE